MKMHWSCQKGNIMKNYKNLIFDLGDVLLSYRWRGMLMDQGLSAAEAEEIGHKMFDEPRKLWHQLDLGIRSTEDIIREFEEEFPELDKAEIIFKVNDLFQREKLLDRLCWNKAAELVDFDILSIDTILSLLVRLHIADRWNRLDPKTGAVLFKQLVSEVRGTFQGINPDQL